jgi:hypothetical protein
MSEIEDGPHISAVGINLQQPLLTKSVQQPCILIGATNLAAREIFTS